MKFQLFCAGLVVGWILWAGPAFAQKKAASKKHVFDTTQRVLWKTSRIQGTPQPPSPYRTAVAFPHLKFYEPLAMTRVPKSNLLAIGERPGKVFAFLDRRDTKRRQLVLDVGQTIYGLAFHPNYVDNGYLFVSVDVKGKQGRKGRIEIRRYRAQPPGSFRADPKSGVVLLGWPADGHRGGCLRFGPDGYLYIGVGDGSGIADQLKTGQNLGDLLGSILRIDVDGGDKDKAYRVPQDNPFVGRPGARPEIWAYGLRQPWKFSFDRKGRLWAGEVGQDLWEMIYLIERGGNYGWSVREGRHPFRPERKKGPTPFKQPLFEHPHSDFRSITGGYIYYDSRRPELQGEYLYADYDTGQIRGLRLRDGKVVRDRELHDTQMRIVAFGQDRAGEVYLVDFVGGQIHWLVPAPKQKAAQPFPRKLSQTGLFADTRKMTPAAGLIPYSVNSPLWSDGASKERYIGLPGDSQIEFETVTYPQPAPGSYPAWRFPHDTVLVKTFFLEMEKGNPKSRRRLETRILHHKLMPGTDEYGAQFWRGYTYVWNDEQTDATLLGKDGQNRTFRIKDDSAPGGQRMQTWRFPSRAECTLCHTMAARYALGVQTLQMNRAHDYGGGVVKNQIQTLADLGVFKTRPKKSPRQMPRLVDFSDTKAAVNLRARAYLDANCSHCHRKWGGGNAEFQLLATLPLKETGTLDVAPQQGRFQLKSPHLLVPGQPERSMILKRMTLQGLGRMPHVASNVVHDEAVALIRRWINELGKQTPVAAKGVVGGD